MKQKRNRFWLIMGQAALAVLLFVFLAGVTVAGVAEDLDVKIPLQDVIDDNLSRGVSVDSLMKDLIAAGIAGKDIICGLFTSGADKHEVIEAALDNGMDTTNVVQWAYQCGATREDIQNGFNQADESLPQGWVFLLSEKTDESALEYNFNPPSQSK